MKLSIPAKILALATTTTLHNAAVKAQCTFEAVKVPLPSLMQGGKQPNRRGSSIQRLVLGPNMDTMVMKMALVDNNNFVILEGETKETILTNNVQGYMVYGFDISDDGSRIAYRFIPNDSSCNGNAVCVGYRIINTANKSVVQDVIYTYAGNDADGADTLYDLLDLSHDGTRATTIWKSGTQVHDTSTGNRLGDIIPYQPRSALEAQMEEEDKVLIWNHDQSQENEISVLQWNANTNNWDQVGSNQPMFMASSFSPLGLLKGGSELTFCLRNEETDETTEETLVVGVMTSFDLINGRWEPASNQKLGELQGQSCHTAMFSKDHERILVFQTSGAINTMHMFERESGTWKKKASQQLPAGIFMSTGLGYTTGALDPNGEYFAFLTAGAHPDYPSSVQHFAGYKFSCPATTVGGLCFSGKSTVLTQDRGYVSMEELRIGDMVLAGGKKFSRVYSLAHRNAKIIAKYVQIYADGVEQPLELSHEHMIKTIEKGFIRAESVLVSDHVINAEGRPTRVTKITYNVERKGAFAPFTESGTIVVNGILASNYVHMQPTAPTDSSMWLVNHLPMHWLAHTFQAPHRYLCSTMKEGCTDETYTKERLSTRVSSSFAAAKWLLGHNEAVFGVVLVPLTAGVALTLSIAEFFLTSSVLLLGYWSSVMVLVARGGVVVAASLANKKNRKIA